MTSPRLWRVYNLPVSKAGELTEAPVWNEIEGAVSVTLRGDRPEHKLLGIQFGGV